MEGKPSTHDTSRTELGERLLKEASVGNLDGVQDLIVLGVDVNYSDKKVHFS